MSGLPKKASGWVDEDRLWARQMHLATFGATEKGGVNRQALSAEEVEARKLLAAWAGELGLKIYVDDISNLFFRLEGQDPSLAPVVTGSHIDSQPTGGKYDGSYGVVAGFEALQAVIESGAEVKRSLDVAVWLNEEGSRFAPGMMGSEAYAGVRPLDRMLPVTDKNGVSVADDLPAAIGAVPSAEHVALGGKPFAFIEAHIEQGPILEAENKTVGVVTGIQGVRRMRVRVTGEEAHAGTTPTADRRDANRSAARIIAALYDSMDIDPEVKFTVGMIDISPNVPSVIAADVLFSIDIRHPDSALLQSLEEKVPKIAAQNAGTCEVEVTTIAESDSIYFNDAVTDAIEDACVELETPYRRLFSCAGHDARQLSYVCPTSMIFVPCEKGLSHNEAENATPGDLAAGARVLADVMVRLGNADDNALAGGA